LDEREKLAMFERAVAPHFPAAFNLARWLVRNDQDAEDVVQEASLRAYRAIGRRYGGDGRAWFLAIVRNAAYTWLQRSRRDEIFVALDDRPFEPASDSLNPETALLSRLDRQAVADALDALPVEFREIIILRELEDMSYKQIAEVTSLPIGTVMSRLARARRRLQSGLAPSAGKELHREL